jgi:O-antigen/teichoic acid export membrane protein
MIRKKATLLLAKFLPYRSELIWIVLGLFVQLFSGVFIIKILTNILNTQEYGTFSLINSIIQFIEVVIFSSLIQGAGRYSYYLKDISHAFEFTKILSSKIFFALICVFFLLAIFFLFQGKIDFTYYCFLIVVLIYLDVNRDIIIGIFHMNRARKIVTLFKSLDQMLRMFSVVTVGFLGLISLVNIYIGFIFTTLFLFFFLFKKKTKLQSGESISYKNIEKEKKSILEDKILKFAFPFALTSVFTWLLTWADRWVLNAFLPIDKVGIYSANSQIANVPFMIISSIALAFFAPILFSKAENITKTIELESYLIQINKIFISYIFLSFFSLILVLMAQNSIIKIMLNTKFISSGYLFILISIGWLLYQIGQVQATLYLYTTSDSKAALISSVIAGIVYLLSLIIFVKKFNEIGAAFSFIISNSVRILLQFVFSIKSWNTFKLKIINMDTENSIY